MDSSGFSASELRIITAAIGALVLLLIFIFGRPKKPGQGKRTLFKPGLFKRNDGGRIEPTLGTPNRGTEDSIAGIEMPVGMFAEDPKTTPDGVNPTGHRREALVGARPSLPIERIVTLFVAARAGTQIQGPDLIVAAEKAGLQFGDLGIFHRLPAGKLDSGPVFSVANMTKPGSFDMSKVDELTTSGVTFFMTLPGPLTALDAWDAMLPSAQRLAELLNAQVLDDERNALGRQRIAHIRDELRAYDRKQDRQQIKPVR